MGKKVFLMFSILLLIALPLLAQDGSKEKILGTHHDFLHANPDGVTVLTTSDGNDQVCAFCHIPHQLAAGNRVLLWNHQFGANTTYTPYASATLDATVVTLDSSNASQLSGQAFYSLACLSCHDGQTAINTVYRVPMGYTNEGTNPGLINGPAFQLGAGTGTEEYVIGTDLSNDHPVNFLYDANLATTDQGLFNPVGGGAVTLGGTATSGIWSVRPLTRGASGDVTQPILFNGYVECATCHNPHNETNDAFLRVDNTASALCLKCHQTT